ncbi:MAG: hypothetical protein KKB70_08430, partial [Proteobacteria bacterium]|nr:hypothetical protein [Pseudomonadota bacterium]
FVLAGQASEPSTMPDTAALVDQAAQNADVAVVDDFSEVFTTASVSEWLRTSAIGSVRDVISQARQVTDLAALPVSSVALFAASAESLEAEITSLVGLPSSLAERLLELLGSLLPDVSDTSGGWPAQAALAVLSVPATLSELSLSATANRVLEATNAAAIADLVSRASVINAARNSASLEFESYDQAVTVRSELVEALDVAASSAPDPVFRTLTDLRVAVVRDITARGANLARLTTWTPQATLPSLVVAHKIYGDASRATEIVSRNRVRHPGAVPGGQTLEVLTNA